MHRLALHRWGREPLALVSLGLIALVIVALYMTLDAKGSWSFVLQYRGTKLFGMALVGTAIALSTIVFQSVTENRILTPSIMGFDWLYMLIQTLIVFFLGGTALFHINDQALFLIEAGFLSGFAILLFGFMFGRAGRDLHAVILSGFILGILFRSLTEFMQRVISPNDFTILQDRAYARLSELNQSVLLMGLILIVAAGIYIWINRHMLDIVALGRPAAINLGVDYHRFVIQMLIMVAVLVAVATALVGPLTFLGLLVVHLAYQVTGTTRNTWSLPAAILISVICLAGGQMVLERLFEFNTSLSIIIEFAGGILFVALLLRNKNND